MERRQKILLGICSRHASRQLRAREDDGAVDVFEHIVKRGRAVCHRVRTVRDDERIVLCAPLGDSARHADPVLGLEVRRVKLQELHAVDVAARTQIGNHREDVLARKRRHEPVRRRPRSDRPARREHADVFLFRCRFHDASPFIKNISTKPGLVKKSFKSSLTAASRMAQLSGCFCFFSFHF